MSKGRKNRWFTALTASVLSITCLGVFVVASSTVGGESDPLITKSYLEEQVTPALRNEVNATAEAEMDEKLVELNQELEALRQQVSQTMVGGTGQYEVVSLDKGDSITLNVGTQVLLRSGVARATSTDNPSFVNLTQGSTINTGSNLTANHLYLASATGRSILATSDDTVLMVYGGYVLQLDT